MILQGRDIQPEPSEKSGALKIILNMCRTVYSSSQKTRHELTLGGLCFTRQASILHAECLCQKGFQSSERLFQNLDEQNKGLTLRTSAIYGAAKQKGFNVDSIFDRKGIQRHPCGEHQKQETVSH